MPFPIDLLHVGLHNLHWLLCCAVDPHNDLSSSLQRSTSLMMPVTNQVKEAVA